MNKIAIQREKEFNELNIDYDGLPIDCFYFSNQQDKGFLSLKESNALRKKVEAFEKQVTGDNVLPFRDIKHLLPSHLDQFNTLECAGRTPNRMEFIHTIPDWKYLPQEFQPVFKSNLLLLIARYFNQDLRVTFFGFPEERSWTDGSELIIKMLENNAQDKIPTISWDRYFSKNPVYFSVLRITVLCWESNPPGLTAWAQEELKLYGLQSSKLTTLKERVRNINNNK